MILAKCRRPKSDGVNILQKAPCFSFIVRASVVFLGSSNIGLKVERSLSCDGNRRDPRIQWLYPHFALFCFDFWATSSYIKDFLLTLHLELLLVVLRGPYGILEIEPE